MTNNNWEKIWNKREEYSLTKGIDESKKIDNYVNNDFRFNFVMLKSI